MRTTRIFFILAFCLLLIATSVHMHASQQLAQKAGSEKKVRREKLLTLRDEKTQVVFYVESDLQHIAALDKDGKVVWHRNMVDQLVAKENRGKPIQIVFIGKTPEWMVQALKDHGKAGDYIAITFSNREFGLFEQNTGVYKCLGGG